MKIKDIEDIVSEVLFTEDQLYERLDELAAQIDAEYEGKEPPVLLGVLRGAAPTVHELSKRLKTKVLFDWIAISSYQNATRPTGDFLVEKSLTLDVSGREVIVIDEIFDTGNTFAWIQDRLKDSSATKIEFFALLEKKERHLHDIKPKYIGFQVPDKFVTGFGLDYYQQYRNLMGIVILKVNA
ncbi:MAG: hypoxanthine phosphoribosyltransferase [Bifidobacteriaceae bacterium]|jgi:hypoxanthine phosphoribosyltransferase|nr:hypoxanthine phosphoribosyltransferase [Bifidobacteriaceae bacterium]